MQVLSEQHRHESRLLPAGLHLLLALVLFLFYPCGLEESLSAACLALTLPADLMLLFPGRSRLRKGTLPLSFLCGCYASFALFGKNIFALEEKIMVIGFSRLLCFAAAALWATGMLIAFVLLAERVAGAEQRPSPAPKPFFRTFLPMFLLFSVIQALFVIAFYPGGYPADSGNVLQQALGMRPLTDANPILNTLMIRLLLTICPRAWFVTLVQAIGYAAVTAWFLTEMTAAGMKPAAAAAVGCVFLLLPNQAVNSIDVVKDTPFTYALLTGMLLLFRLIRDPGEDRGIGWTVGMAMSIFGIACLRHNGTVPAAGLAAVLILTGIVLTVRKKEPRPRQGRRLWAAGAAGLCLFALWRGPVMHSLVDIQPDEISAFTALQQGVAAVIANDLPLSEETTALMETALPLSEWKAGYDPWAGPDAYLERPDGSPEMDRSQLSTASLMKAYLEALSRYPAVVIKDRLNATDILWDVTQPSSSFNARYFQGVSDLIPEEVLAWPSTDSPVSKLCRSLYEFYQPNVLNASWHGLADALLWRPGLYLILCLALALCWFQRRLSGMLLPACLVIFHAGALMLCLYHQSFRYVYALQPMSLLLSGMTLSLLRSAKTKADPE